MEYTYEQKLEMAKNARVRIAPSQLPESQLAYLDQVEITNCFLETRNGQTSYYLVENKEKKTLAPLIMSIHGGGFCKGYGKADTAFSAMLAVETGAVVLDLDYKLSPENPFPVAYEEGYDLLKWAYEHAEELGADKEKIILCGQSSGGNLAAVIAMEAAKTKEIKVRLQILNYPPMDVYTDPADKPEASKSYIPFDKARAYNTLYIEKEEDAKNPYVSPIFATRDMLECLPDALVITAENDSLHNEAETYAVHMMEAGVKVTMKKFLNSNHGFIIYCMGDEWHNAHKLIIDAINKNL